MFILISISIDVQISCPPCLCTGLAWPGDGAQAGSAQFVATNGKTARETQPPMRGKKSFCFLLCSSSPRYHLIFNFSNEIGINLYIESSCRYEADVGLK